MSSSASRALAHDTQGTSLEELARAFAARPDDIVFVSGSRLEGLGNERSDYDLYVIQPDGDETPPFVTMVLDGAYLVCETFSYSHAARVAATINATRPGDFSAVWSLSWFEVEFYYRVLIGHPLANPQAYADLKGKFQKPVIDRCVHAWCGLRAAVHLEEADRKRAINKMKGAYTSAQQAAAAATDSFLAARGESYTSFKWRFEKLRRCVGESDEMFRRAWHLKSLGARDIGDYIDEVKAFCTELGMEAFRSWSLANVIYRPANTARLMVVGGVPYIIDNRNTLYQLTDAGRRMWSWVNGSTGRGELIRRAGTEAVMSEPEADAFLFALAEHGLIQ